MMDRRIPVAARLLLGAVMMSAPVAARAAEPTRIDYIVYVGGVATLDAAFELHGTDESYVIGADARMRGLLGRMFPWSTRAQSDGRIESGRALPARHVNASTWRDRTRTVTMDYGPDGTVDRITHDPPDERQRRERVTVAQRQGATDALSAILAALDRVSKTDRCDLTVPVYDGRRRFDMIFTDGGATEIARSRYSDFAGTARACRVGFKTIAGGRGDRESSQFWSTRDPATGLQGWPTTVFVAPVGDGRRMVPVRFELDSPFGWIVAHLRSYRAGGPHGRDAAAPG